MAVLQCPACKSGKSISLYRWGGLPLGVLQLPTTEAQALATERHPIDLCRCAMCGHVFHREFDTKEVSYNGDSTMVFNRAPAWMDYQNRLAEGWVKRHKLRGKRIVEIGCGDGSFLENFLEFKCQCTGFEPGRDSGAATKRNLKVIGESFQVSRLRELKPDAIVCRHVLEHLSEPMDFLQEISLECERLRIRPFFLAEVPRIEKAMEQKRIGDFFYEHVSHFTENSFRTLFELSGFDVVTLKRGYGDEVMSITARVGSFQRQDDSKGFGVSVARQTNEARKTAERWRQEGKRIALWGAAGKGATLINMLGFTKDLFPIVVDSDEQKAGYFVPGTGQEIQTPSYLKDHSVDGILICTNWRARDIEREIRKELGLNVPLYVQLNEKIVTLTKRLAI